MGVDWVIDLPCEPRRLLGSERLVALAKVRSRAEEILVATRAEGLVQSPAKVIVRETARRLRGDEARETTLAELLAEGAALDDLEPFCIGCPVNLGGSAFGCRGAIAYPIEASTERWLLSLLPNDEASTAGGLLASAAGELRRGLDLASEMRASSRTFFEVAEPPSRDWRSWSVDGDLVFALLFGAAAIAPAHAAAVSLIFGLLPESISLDELRVLAAEPAALGAALERSPRAIPDADDQRGDIATFLRAVAAAAVHGVRTLVDA